MISGLLIWLVIVLLKFPLFKVSKNEYKLNENTIENVKTPTNEVKTLLDVVADDNLVEIKNQPIVEKFKQLSVLDNQKDGYKFVYPYGFDVQYSAEFAKLIPPNKQGGVVLTIQQGSFKLEVISQGLESEQIQMLADSGRLVSETFEFVERNNSFLQNSERFK